MRRVWAVARNTMAQAIRMKVALVIIMLLLIVLPVMSFIMIGDGTLHGKLQTFISYGMSLVSLLLCVLTIAMSVYTLTSDLKLKQIFLVVTKPIHRFELLVGKFLGIIILDAFLLIVFAFIIYGLTLMIPRLSDADQAEIEKANREFFTARVGLKTEIDEKKIEKAAFARYEELEKTGQLPRDMNRIKVLRELRGQELLKARVVEPGKQKLWEFENVKPTEGTETLFIRYKYEVSGSFPDMEVKSVWVVGDYRQQERLGPGLWENPVYRVDRSDVVKMFREFEVPADAIADDGYLAVAFNNLYENRATVIPDDVEVLYKAGGFAGNFLRVVLMVFARLVFLSALGVSLSTWLSFPVAILVCFSIFFVGTVNGFVVDSFDYMEVKGLEILYSLTLKPLLWLFPRFDGDFNPTRFMISARFLSWSFLLEIYGAMVAIKSIILLLLGIWIFSNKEIAKTIV
jgi:hypothetical protein